MDGLPAVNLYDGSLGRTLSERRPAFFDEMALRRAREQQQQVDAGGGQAASQTTGRRQVEFSDRGGTSEECWRGPWTPICIKGHRKVCQQFRRDTADAGAKEVDAR